MRKKKDTHSFDFRPLGLAIREAREKAGLSRNDLGDKVFYGERHIADIENIGKHPRACLKNKNCTKRMFYFPFS